MLVFSFSIRSSSNNSNGNHYRRHISTYLNSVTGTRTHILFTFSRFFSLSLSLQSLYTWCCLFAQSLSCTGVFACMCITMAEKNLCIFVYTVVVLPLIQSILPCIPVFFIEMVNLASIETYLSIR